MRRSATERTTFFVDTNVIVYAATDGPHRRASIRLLEAVVEGTVEARTSVAVIEEVWHIELSGRAGHIGGLADRAYDLFTPLLPVTDEVVRAALLLDVKGLGANDRVHLATCREHDIEIMVSADVGFDHVPGLQRVDPLEGPRFDHLLRG